jgi:hypothetical protein
MNIKLLLWVLIAGVWGGLSAGALAADDSRTIARNAQVAGKFRKDQCLPFARDLYGQMVQAGGEAHLVVYQWNDAFAQGQKSGYHAIVVYRDSSGRYFGVDNLTWKPKWLKGSTPSEWAMFFAGFGKQVAVTQSITEPTLRGSVASLDRAPRNLNNREIDQLAAARNIAGR